MALPLKTTLTILAFGGILLLTDLVPALKNYKVFDWHTVPKVLDFVDRRPNPVPEQAEQQRLRPETEPLKQTRFPILDTQHQMDHFYEAVHRASLHPTGQQVKVLHYGDSPTTADMITADARKLLQKQFGDGGHGFTLIAKPWAWYAHDGVDLSGQGWTIDPANQSSAKDGIFGIGAVSFRAGAGAHATLRLKDKSHSKIELAFWKQPGGGQLRLASGGTDLGVIRTDAEAPGSGFEEFDLPEGATELSLRVMSGPVRVFGWSLRKASSGVVYNSLGVNGAYVSVLAKFMNETHWREQLAHYNPDLVIVNYGTNESMYANFVDYASEKEIREVVRRIRLAAPKTSILLMSPMDRGQRMAAGEIGTVPTIPRLVAIQRRVALDTGCAFFNTFEAMGGVGTMARWYEAEPRLVGADFIHPMPGGARIVGGLLYQALLDGYNKYKLRLIQKTMVAGRR